MIRVFVSGPYSAETATEIEANVSKICDAIGKLALEGFAPSLLILGHFAPFRLSYSQWLDLALEEVSRCDCLLRVGGASPGADLEVLKAFSLGKRIYRDLDELMRSERALKASETVQGDGKKVLDKWTREKPSKPGIYCVRNIFNQMVQVFLGEDSTLRLRDVADEKAISLPLTDLPDAYEWLGPFELKPV